MKQLFALLTILPCFSFGQQLPRLQQAQHTISLGNDSLTIFQEAEFYDIVDWYSDSADFKSNGTTITLNIYYEPKLTGGTWTYPSTTKDTFSIGGLSVGHHILVVNSYEYGDSVDNNFNYYEFYTLRDSDTSYFQVLSNNSIPYREKPLVFYPNPAQDKITLQGLKPEDGEVEVSIRDRSGREILQAQVSYHYSSIVLPALAKGTYLIKTSTSPVFQKLLIE